MRCCVRSLLDGRIDASPAAGRSPASRCSSGPPLTSPSWTDPTGTYAVTLDKFGRSTVLDDPVNTANFTWTYRADGQPASFGAPNGNTEPPWVSWRL